VTEQAVNPAVPDSIELTTDIPLNITCKKIISIETREGDGAKRSKV
jgi:hypothetical protein